MTDRSNTADRINELRRNVASNKGKARRARSTAGDLLHKARECEAQVRLDQAELEAMGAKVIR